MSAAVAGLITEGLDEIVAILEAAGIAATRDPGAFEPPGAIVGAPTVLGVNIGGALSLSVPVYLVTPDPGQAGLDDLLAMLVVAMPALRQREAIPTTWTTQLNRDGLPAYLITTQLLVSEG